MTGTPFKVGDRISLKKKHPCGGSEWEIYRIGADIRMICLTCERRMMLSRRDAKRRTVARVEASDDAGSKEQGTSSESV